jgi:serine/threonine protein kinase
MLHYIYLNKMIKKRYALKTTLKKKKHPVEANILVKLKNEYLIKYKDSFVEAEGIYYCIVMEYCEVNTTILDFNSFF